MNRIKLRPLAELELQKRLVAVPDDETTESTGSSLLPDDSLAVFDTANTVDLLDYSLFIPQHYEAHYAYPLVVWLHSDESDHSQLLKMMPQLSTRNFAAVSIGSPDRDRAVDGIDNCWRQDPFSIDQTAQRVQIAIEHAKLRLNIDRARVFIAGSGSGGAMAFRMAFSFPNWFAGVASLNGSVPENLQPLSNWQQSRDVPIFWVHARKSQNYKEINLCRDLRLLHIAGFSVVLKQYPCDDRLDPGVFSDLNSWIMETIAAKNSENSIIR